MNAAAPTFFARHEFLIRRLHSLSGLVPVGAYMTVHLLVNSTLLNGPGAFQQNVNQIHSLGKFLLTVEWGFIFLPLIFHAVVGLWIIQSGQSNASQYKFVNNRRYTLQRWSGVLATVFILLHVFHLHGWFHFDAWLKNVAEPLGMAQFRPYNAASTLARALSGYGWPVFYAIGVTACVYHLANGIWTMGITWGVWLTPKAQQRANYVCGAFGVFLLVVGLSALFAAKTTSVDEARQVEDAMYEQKVKTGEIIDDPHKRYVPHDAGQAMNTQPAAAADVK
jgi:succinate dehydrogenase / fumarate reductase, cytochrome b subunit